MRKIILSITIALTLVVGIFSFAKYFNMSVCCQATCNSVPAVSSECSSNHTLSVSHHLEMVNSYTVAIMNNAGGFMLLGIILLASLFLIKLWTSEDRLGKSTYLKYKTYHKIVGKHMNPFDPLRLLLSKGIIGSQKHFA